MKEEYFSYKFSEDFHLLNSRKKLSYDITEIILSYLCFYPLLASAIYSTHYNKDEVRYGILLLIPLILMTVIRKKAKSFIMFLLYTLLVIAAGTLITWTDGIVILNLIFLISYGIYSILKRVKLKNSFWGFSKLALMNLFLAAVYGFAILNKFEFLEELIFFFALLNLFIFIIYFHYTAGEKILQWEQYTNEEHIKYLKIINVIVSFIIALFIGTVIFLAKNIGLLGILDNAYSKICNLLFGAFKMTTVSTADYMDMDQNPMFPISQNISQGISNTTILFKAFVVSMKFLFFAIIIIDLILIILVVVQKLYSRYYRKLILGEQVESTLNKEQISQKIRPIRNPLQILKKSILKTNKEKLRRIYYKNIMNYKRKGAEVECFNTPSEIEENIKSKSVDVDLKEATEVYEKFRYKVDEPTDEELIKMKGMFKR